MMPSIVNGVFQILREQTEKAVSEALETGSRRAENLDIFSFTLSDSEMSAITALDKGKSVVFDANNFSTPRFIHNRTIHYVALYNMPHGVVVRRSYRLFDGR